MFRKRKKHQVRIRPQNPPSSKNKFRFYLILLIILSFGIFILNQNFEEQKDIQKEVLEKPSLTAKEIQKKIQGDYKSNLLKRKITKDEILHEKNKNIPEKALPGSNEDYTLKGGVSLSQDESFDNLLSILKEADEEPEEDIEDRIAHYRIIEKRIQNFQGNPQEKKTEDNIDSRKAYAQEFIENARKGGYEVNLDNNFKVTSVKKIKPDPYEEALLIEENN